MCLYLRLQLILKPDQGPANLNCVSMGEFKMIEFIDLDESLPTWDSRVPAEKCFEWLPSFANRVAVKSPDSKDRILAIS